MDLPENTSKDLILRFSRAAHDEELFISDLASEDKAGLIDLVSKCLTDTSWRKLASHEQFLGRAIHKLSDISQRGGLSTAQRTKIIGLLLEPENHAEILVRKYWSERVPVKTQSESQKVPIVALASYSDALRLMITKWGFKEEVTGEIAFPELSEDSLYALQKLLEGDNNAIYLMTHDDVIGLLDFCTQYGITEPLEKIDHYLTTYMTPEDTLETYIIAKRYGRHDVVQSALTMFQHAYDPASAAEINAWARDNDATEVRQYIENPAINNLYSLITAALKTCKGDVDELLDRLHADKENAQKTWSSTVKEFTDGLLSGSTFKKLEGPRVFLGLRDEDAIQALQPALDSLAKLGTLFSLGDLGRLKPESQEALLRLLKDSKISYERVNLSGADDVSFLIKELPSTILELDLSHTSGFDQEALELLVDNHPNLRLLKLPSGAHLNDLSSLCKLKNLTDLDITGQPIKGDELIAITQSCPNLRQLNMCRSPFQKPIDNPQEVLEALASGCPHLKTLNISNCFELLSAPCITHLEKLRLSNLGMAGIEVDEPKALAQALGCMPWLETVDLSRLKGFDACLLDTLSAKCPKLRELNLSDVKELSAEALTTLLQTHGHQIELLNLSGCLDIDDEKAQSFAVSLPQLKSLILNNCALTAQAIEGLTSLKNLKMLGLSGLNTQLDEESRKALFTLINTNPTLRYLTLSGAGYLGDHIMWAIEHCTGLTTLDLSYCTLLSTKANKNKDIQLLNLPDLETLDVSGTNISVNHLKMTIKNAPNLRHLRVDNLNQLSTIEAWEIVKHYLPNVESLSMNWIPKDSLSALIAYHSVIQHMSMPKLEYLSLQGHKITTDELGKIYFKDPDCLNSLRVLDIRFASVDPDNLEKATQHLDFVRT